MEKTTHNAPKREWLFFFLVLTVLTLLDCLSTYFALTYLGKQEFIPFNQFFLSHFGLAGGLACAFLARMPINLAISYLIKDYFVPKLIIALGMCAVITLNMI